MNKDDEMGQRIIDSIMALPPHKQEEAIHKLINGAIKQMPLTSIFEIREKIASQFPADIPIVASTLNLIDGQIALREVAGFEQWR